MTAPFPPPVADLSNHPHAVVIGAGLGGLAAAARLGAKGYRVTVLEKLDGPGGRAYVFRQDGFTFDAGPTIVTAPYIFEQLWEACGARLSDDVELRPCDPFYKIRFDDGSVFNYSGDPEKMRAEVARFNPEDVAGFARFMKRSGEIYKVAFEELADKPFHSLLFTAKAMADLVRLGGYWPVYSTVSRFFKDPRLRIVFSFHPLLIGGNPFATTSYYCLIAHLESKYGVHYAVGGTGALVRGIAGLVERQGGTIRYDAEVAEITTNGPRASGVRLQSGEVIAADIVVSNADPAWTYGKLLGNHRRRRWTDAKIKNGAYSMSLFVWYFGTNRKFDDVYHHTMVLGPRYKGLLTDIFKKHRLAEDFSLYLHRPTASDPSLAPDGCDAFYVLSPVPHLASGTDWTIEAERYRAAIQQRLEETMMPGLGKSIVTSRMLTPLDFRDRLLSHQGAAFALEPKLLQSAWFRPHNKSEEVENLYLVGAGTHPGAGMPGVLTSAKLVADLIPAAQQWQRA
jgi:phytoene desaturase